jgi:hypothetical protein
MFAELQYGTRFKIDQQEYEIRKVKESQLGCDLEVHNITYDTLELLSLDDLLRAYNNKTLSFRKDEKDHSREAVKWDLGLYSPDQLKEMEDRYSVIKPYLAGDLDDLKSYLFSYPAAKRPRSTPVLSLATFYRWVDRYRKREFKIDLIPFKSGPKGRRVTDEEMNRLRDFNKDMDKMAEAITDRDKWSLFIGGIKEENLCRDEINQLPRMSESTFRRVFNKLRNPYLRDKQILLFFNFFLCFPPFGE